MLLSGAEGSGRHSMAMAIAKYLLCHNPGEKDACHSCPACKYFEAATHPDFIHLASPDNKDIKVERVRAEVLADLHHRPPISRSKVYLIDADYLNESGQNALLKSLEEPPTYAHFLLTAEDTDKLLQTVVSRSRELPLAPLNKEELLEILRQRGLQESLDFIASYAKGNPGRALNLAEKEGFAALREETLNYLCALPEKNYLNILYEDQNFLLEEKERIEDIWEIIQSLLRDLALLYCGQEEKMLNLDKAKQVRELGNKIWFQYNKLNLSTEERKVKIIENLRAAEAKQTELRKALQSNANFEILTWTYLQNLKSCLSPQI